MRFEWWTEWQRKCALDSCSDDAIAYLAKFGRARLEKYLEELRAAGLAAEYTSPGGNPQQRRAWHRFENYMYTPKGGKREAEPESTSPPQPPEPGKQGKTYKDWLFDRVATLDGTPLAIVESTASRCFRTVAKEMVRAEGPGLRDSKGHIKVHQISMADPAGDGPHGNLTIQDLLPTHMADPAADAELNIFRELASKFAPVLFDELGRRERLIIAARASGVSLANPVLGRLMQCRKSAIYALNDQIVGIASTTRHDSYDLLLGRRKHRAGKPGMSHPGKIEEWLRAETGDDSCELRPLVLLLFERLQELCVSWAKQPENSAEELFNVVDGDEP